MLVPNRPLTKAQLSDEVFMAEHRKKEAREWKFDLVFIWCYIIASVFISCGFSFCAGRILDAW